MVLCKKLFVPKDNSQAQVISISLEILQGFEILHQHGIVHRDVKPDNILFDETGRAKLIDFGFADHDVTENQDKAGTFLYSSPEQSGTLKRAVDARSDLYSLGVVLYEALSRRVPLPLAKSL